jgi:hypothetical protein
MKTVIVRLAQNIGLHREGATMQLEAFEVEIRGRLWYRLWWHICLLDVR